MGSTAPRATARTDYTELSIRNAAQAKAFYAAAFGWTFQEWGPDYLSFHDGTREAGGMRVESDSAAPIPVLLTDDLERVKEQVVAAGGTIVGPDHVFPGGRRFHFRDPSGNELAVWTKTGV